MKKWKIIKIVTIIIPIIFMLNVIIDIIACMNMSYPHPSLGIDTHNWFEQFQIDMAFIMLYWIIPLIVDVILLVVSIKKTKK